MSVYSLPIFKDKVVFSWQAEASHKHVCYENLTCQRDFKLKVEVLVISPVLISASCYEALNFSVECVHFFKRIQTI